jgi:thiol-disulfide isomerase/thioredoxin
MSSTTSGFLNYFYYKTRSYSTTLTYVAIVVIFVIISCIVFYYYNKNTVSNPLKQFNDVANTGLRENELEIKFYYANWCPYCKKAMPEWQAFCDENNGKEINGHIVVCDRNGVDCSKETDPLVKDVFK